MFKAFLRDSLKPEHYQTCYGYKNDRKVRLVRTMVNINWEQLVRAVGRLKKRKTACSDGVIGED